MVKMSLILPCFLRQCNAYEIAGLIIVGRNIALVLFQIIDNFWTYYIYQLVCNRQITMTFSILVFLYVSLALYTSTVYSLVVPAFVDDDTSTLIFVDLQFGLSYIAYLVVFTYLTVRELRTLSQITDPETASVLMKNAYKVIGFNFVNISMHAVRPLFAWNMECGNNGDPDTIGGCWLLWDLYWQNSVIIYMHVAFNSQLAEDIITFIHSAYKYSATFSGRLSYLYASNLDTTVCDEGLHAKGGLSSQSKLTIAHNFPDPLESCAYIDDKILEVLYGRERS